MGDALSAAPPESDDPRQLGRLFAIAQVGLEMVAPIILGILLDNWLGTGPWLLVVGAAVGLIGGIYHLVKMLDSKDGKNPPTGPAS